MKAAIYCRLSKEDEDAQARGKESESIQNQRSMLIRYALEQGYEICRIYADEDYSGIDRDRPDFNRMLEAARRHEFDIVLAKTQSRFTRDMELVEKYLHGRFAEWGIRFIAVVDRVDTADPANKKSRQINGLVNEWYLEDLSGNIRSVLTHKRREGRYIASFALYGYQKDPLDPGHLIIDPEAAEVVRQIFETYLAGSGVTRIARCLNEQGIPSPTRYRQEHGPAGKRPDPCGAGALWSRATVHQMLKNRTYAGDLEQGRHKRVSYKSKKTVWLPREQWIVVPGTHEPIIDPETFARVQRLMGARARGGGAGVIDPLAGKVFCGLCGGRMEQTGSGRAGSGAARRYFRCRMPLRDHTRCAGQNYLPVQELAELVLKRIRHHAEGWTIPQELLAGAALPPRAEQRRASRQAELARLQAGLARRQKALRELYLDKSGGLIDAAQFAQLNTVFLREAAELEQRCAALAGALEQSPETDTARQAVPQRLRDAAAFTALDRELAALLVDRIIVYPPDLQNKTRAIELVWNF